jgi:hypothetical protein
MGSAASLIKSADATRAIPNVLANFVIEQAFGLRPNPDKSLKGISM